VLSSFEIVNFRTFSHLRIERLGRVNLVVGKNGVGKSTFLESLRFYGMGNPLAIQEYLTEQQEWTAYSEIGEGVLDLRSLFHCRETEGAEIILGPLGDTSQRLTITAAPVVRVQPRHGEPYYQRPEELDSRFRSGEVVTGTQITGARIRREEISVLLDPRPSRRLAFSGRYVGPPLVPADGVPEPNLSSWWDD